MFFKTATIAVMAAFLTAQAGAATTAPLAAGKPAGVHGAQLSNDVLIPLGISLGAVIGIVAATSNAGSLPASPTISTASATTTG